MPSIVQAGLSAVALFFSLLLAFVLAMSGCVSGHKTSRSTPLRDASVEAIDLPAQAAPRAVPMRAEADALGDAGPAREVGDGPRVVMPVVARGAVLAHAIRETALPPLPPPDVPSSVAPSMEGDDERSSPQPAALAAPLPEAPPSGGVALAYARQALGSVPVADCRARGLPAGYGHALVTFDATGRAVRVRLDGGEALAREAVACVGERLGAAKVEAFEGSPITVGTSWYLP